MDKNLVIQNLNNNILYEIKKSSNNEINLFSITHIPINTLVIHNIPPITGYHFNKEEIKDLNPKIKNLCQQYFEPKDKNKIFIPQDPSILSKYYFPNYFLSHSDNPNVKNDGGNIVSIKNIKNGEKITIDFKQYYPTIYKKFKKTKKKK